MDEKNKLTDDVQVDTKRGSGSLLAAARKSQNKTVEEIAHELNLSVTQIRTIESDQSEGLPEPTYVRGYIRSYARLLGLEADEILEHYLNPNWQKGARLDDMPRDIGSADDGRKKGFLSPFKLVALLLIIAFIAFLLFSGKMNDFLGTSNFSANQTDNPSSSVDQNDPNPEALAGQPAASQTSESAANQDPEQLSPTNADETASGASSSPAENVLQLIFTDTSWVDIRDGNGERLAYKSYAQGEDLVVSSKTGLSVFIGNAKAVSATLNGENYDISQYREGVFARFTIAETE